MPTKQHVDGPPLSPAWTWRLMAGTLPTARLPGWVEQVGTPNAGPALWAAHGEQLTAEAATAGFRPSGLTTRTPTGDGFEQWRARFLALHTY